MAGFFLLCIICIAINPVLSTGYLFIQNHLFLSWKAHESAYPHTSIDSTEGFIQFRSCVRNVFRKPFVKIIFRAITARIDEVTELIKQT